MSTWISPVAHPSRQRASSENGEMAISRQDPSLNSIR